MRQTMRVAPVARFRTAPGPFDLQTPSAGSSTKQGLGLGQNFSRCHLDHFKLDLASFNLGQIQNVIEQFEQGLARRQDGACVILALGLPDLGHRQHLRHAQDAVHRGAHFMAHGRQELTLGQVRSLGGLLRLLQFNLDLLGLRDVTLGRDVVSDVPVGAAYRRNNGGLDEFAAVLAPVIKLACP